MPLPRRPLPLARPKAPTAPKATTAPPADVALHLLHVVHVERGGVGTTTHDGTPRTVWDQDEAGTRATAAALLAMAERLGAIGGRLSVMGGEQWWSAVARWLPELAPTLTAAGHLCGLHERGGYAGYVRAAAALQAAGGGGGACIYSGVLTSEVSGFPAGSVFTGMAEVSGHSASGRSIAGMHWSGIWRADDAEGAMGEKLPPSGRFVVIGYGSGSNSKPCAMARDVRAHGGVAVYDGTDPEAVSGYVRGAIHGVMLDAQGLVTGAAGISADDTPERVLANAAEALAVPGVVGATFTTLLAGWDGVAVRHRTAGREAGERHWQGIGGGVQ